MLPTHSSSTRIRGTTGLIALLGSPVTHSKSPGMQNGCFAALGIDLAYLAFDVSLAQVGDAVAALRVLNARGANVTMPLKRAICAHLDALSPAAALAGAVNTIVNDHGVLTGHITDGIGYTRALEAAGVSVRGQTLTIVGVGGAATAVAIQAAMQGAARIHFFNIRDAFFESGAAIVDMLQNRYGCPVAYDDLADHARLRAAMAQSQIFINATPVGMKATLTQSVVPAASFFHRDLIVTDLIYMPERTTLLQMAQAAGCRTVSGLGMQLYQGAEAFRLWTGQDMPIALATRLLADSQAQNET